MFLVTSFFLLQQFLGQVGLHIFLQAEQTCWTWDGHCAPAKHGGGDCKGGAQTGLEQGCCCGGGAHIAPEHGCCIGGVHIEPEQGCCGGAHIAPVQGEGSCITLILSGFGFGVGTGRCSAKQAPGGRHCIGGGGGWQPAWGPHPGAYVGCAGTHLAKPLAHVGGACGGIHPGWGAHIGKGGAAWGIHGGWAHAACGGGAGGIHGGWAQGICGGIQGGWAQAIGGATGPPFGDPQQAGE